MQNSGSAPPMVQGGGGMNAMGMGAGMGMEGGQQRIGGEAQQKQLLVQQQNARMQQQGMQGGFPGNSVNAQLMGAVGHQGMSPAGV